MYFLSDEEKRLVLRRLAPQARERGVAEDLRGWNWHRPPLSPIFDKTRLGVYEVAGQYCPTGRDLYLRRVMKVRVPPNSAMVEGGYLHGVVAGIILAAKTIIYRYGADCLEPLAVELERPRYPEELSGELDHQQVAELRKKAEGIWRYEYRRIVHRVQEAINTHPYIGPDAITTLALPVMVEQRLDGTFLGLSKHLSADAFVTSEAMIIDIKFGPREPFHRLSPTGYALVMESLYEYPVNLGCTVYVFFQDDRLVVEREFYLIDDELRQWFIEARDERARIVEEEIDPGPAQECSGSCPYYRQCHPE